MASQPSGHRRRTVRAVHRSCLCATEAGGELLTGDEIVVQPAAQGGLRDPKLGDGSGDGSGSPCGSLARS
jgi:hypothetical protein